MITPASLSHRSITDRGPTEVMIPFSGVSRRPIEFDLNPTDDSVRSFKDLAGAPDTKATAEWEKKRASIADLAGGSVLPASLQIFPGKLNVTVGALDRAAADVQSIITSAQVSRPKPNTAVAPVGITSDMEIAARVMPSALANSATAVDTTAAVSMMPARSVKFSPFVYRIYDRKRDGALPNGTAAIAGKQIVKGRYIFTVDVPSVSGVGMEGESIVPFTIEGKKAQLEKWRYDASAGELKIQVQILENPLPLLAIGAAIAGLGIFAAGWGLEKGMKSVDTVLVDLPGSIGQIALIAGVGFLFWKFVIKR